MTQSQVFLAHFYRHRHLCRHFITTREPHVWDISVFAGRSILILIARQNTSSVGQSIATPQMRSYPHVVKHVSSESLHQMCWHVSIWAEKAHAGLKLKPNSARMLSEAQHGNTSVASRGFCCKSKKIKNKRHLHWGQHSVLTHSLAFKQLAGTEVMNRQTEWECCEKKQIK